MPSANVTVNLPAPITVSGAAMSLSLDLLVSQSASLASCSTDSYSITPTFAITDLSLRGQPINSASVKETGLLGLVSSVDTSGNSFNVTSQETGVAWSIQSADTTEYQGISGLSALTAGMPVDMDVSVRQDGSLLATRVAVQDTTANHISLYAGPLLLVAHIQVSAQDAEVDPIAFVLNTQAFGQLLVSANYFNFHDDVFRTSGQFANLQSLPFTASFTAANMVPGQDVSLTTHALKVVGSFPYTVADSITLQPQTIDGTVAAVSSDSGFDIYTITLPPYDLFPKMETVEGVTSTLMQPNTVVVYVGNDTQMLNTTSLTVGSVLRFNGLIFNDHGTLRMDCAWVRDGVKE